HDPSDGREIQDFLSAAVAVVFLAADQSPDGTHDGLILSSFDVIELFSDSLLLFLAVILLAFAVPLFRLARERQADRGRRGSSGRLTAAGLHARAFVEARKATRAAVATSESAAPIKKAVFAPKSFHHRPKRIEAGRAARPTAPWKMPKARPRSSPSARSAISALSAPSVAAKKRA